MPNEKISRKEDCPTCGSDLHSCKMCEHYDRSAYNECRESTADRIVEKEKANFCDYFKLSGSGDAGASKEDIIKQAASLFKD